ncbi:hypothetical protein INT44_006768 [Umbelopsis vinacea]|uniref:Secreted protein n=1 Tax=Umbelopsis vinacea TaxID=44442 RepID=A0A8H7PIR8_9FUNG|nr:hypothetical protein INT44_006768 [Umbelopsis vinacea]
MQGFTIFLIIGAIVLSCGPRFSAAAPSPAPLYYHTLGGEYKVLPGVLGECQNLPKDAAAFINPTPFIVAAFPAPDCQSISTLVFPGEKRDGPPRFFSVKVLVQK